MKRNEKLEVWLGEQASDYGGWRMHWKHQGNAYHVYVRPSMNFKSKDLVDFVQNFLPPGIE